MKVFDYKPEAEGWSGSLKIKVPNFKERLTMIKELKLQEIRKAVAEDQVELALGLFDKIKDQVSDLDLECGGVKITDIADLEYISDALPLIMEIVGVLTNGISLGKILSQPSESKLESLS